MSAIAGCCWFDRRPASIDHVRPLAAAAAHRVRAPFTFWTSGCIALGWGPDRSSLHDGLWHDPAARITVVLDGRIDNRRELARDLDLAPGISNTPLVAAAYRRWNVNVGSRLLGDFAFAVWDESARQLVCVRDSMGQRPLFYGLSPRCLVFGSEPQQVLAHGEIGRAINEGTVAEHLTGFPATMDETLWQDVRRLPPAHTLVLSESCVTVVRYWDFDPSHSIAAGSDGEFDERAREALFAAVDCRLQDVQSAGVFLSGGFDSSLVVGLVHTRSTGQQRRPVQILSLLFPGFACDESRYIDTVVSHWQLPSLRVPAVPATLDAYEQEVDRYRDLPPYPSGLMTTPLRRLAVERGVAVALTGCGGDEWFTGSPMHTADLLREGRLLAAVGQVRRDAGQADGAYSYAGLARAALAPLLPGRARRILRELTGRPRFAWIRPEFAARVRLSDRLRPAPTPPFATEAQRDMYRLGTGAAQVLADELEDRAAHAAGLDQRHPFTDRRVAEFGLALPESQRWAGGRTKVILRRSMHDLLPPTVADRRDKAEFSSAFVRALDALGGHELFAALESEAAGWVDGSVIRRQSREMFALYTRGDESYIRLIDPIWAVASLELWLRRAVGAGEKRA